MIAKDYVPPWPRGDCDYYQVTVYRSITSVGAQQDAVWREALAIAGALDDDLVAGIGQEIEGAVAQDGVVEEAQPFVHGPVAGDVDEFLSMHHQRLLAEDDPATTFTAAEAQDWIQRVEVAIAEFLSVEPGRRRAFALELLPVPSLGAIATTGGAVVTR